VIVTSDDPSLPEGCHPRQVAELVISFVDAFNSGDQATLSRIFFVSEGPSPPDFAERAYEPWSWYTVGKVAPGGKIESGFVTYDQRELLRYFAERHEAGERLRLLKVSLTQKGLLGKEDNVGFVYVLNRDAGDLESGLGGPARIASGQGTINWTTEQGGRPPTGSAPTHQAGGPATPWSPAREVSGIRFAGAPHPMPETLSLTPTSRPGSAALPHPSSAHPTTPVCTLVACSGTSNSRHAPTHPTLL
jgi:hypothetical protein